MLRVLLVAAMAAALAAGESINPDLVIKSVERSIDITTQLAKINYKIALENTGKASVKFFLFSVDPKLAAKVAFVGATAGSSEKTYLRVTEAKVPAHPDSPFWRIELRSALASGAAATVAVEAVLGGALEMFPAAITQKEKQLARFVGNLFCYLAYPVTTQTTTVLLPSSTIESYTKTKPVSLADSTLTYGPHKNTAAFSSAELVVHSENNSPMLVVSRLERVVELSMWGNLAVEETVDVSHRGAQLKGSFSRYEFQRENSGVSSVKNFKTLLPAAAKDVYYRDDIGNISTSHLKVMDDAVELDLRPRFPLFGGWKTHYVVGYNVPSYEYVFFKGDVHVLNMRLIDHIYDDMLVEEAEVRVVLPEGVANVELKTPWPVTREKDDKLFTYLDTTGRTVVVMRTAPGQALTEAHIQDFQLQFTFPHRSMLNEPLILVTAFFLLFLLAIVYVRLDFSITVDAGAEVKMKVAGHCEKVAALQDRRAGLYHALEEAILRLKANKEVSAFHNTLRRIGGDQKAESAAIAELGAAIRADSQELGDKVDLLQKQDKTFRDLQAQQATLVEKLVSGKLAKQQYIDQEAAVVRRKEEALERIHQILKAF